MDQGGAGLRERKKERIREAIEMAALDLFEQRGFDGTTLEDVAAAADIAPRTFFHYFPSKEDVVLSDYGRRLGRIAEVLADAPAGDPPVRALRAAFSEVARDYEDNRVILLRRFRIMMGSPSVPRLIAGAALAAMRTALRLWVADGGRTSLPELVYRAFDTFESGLAGIEDRPVPTPTGKATRGKPRRRK
ncbi:MAG: TetR family transcriptional regulator [Actinobacteria bacterium ATB1]|nr:TetR family transcriptional regulator [Actinobacteria bacterium ATB1]